MNASAGASLVLCAPGLLVGSFPHRLMVVQLRCVLVGVWLLLNLLRCVCARCVIFVVFAAFCVLLGIGFACLALIGEFVSVGWMRDWYFLPGFNQETRIFETGSGVGRRWGWPDFDTAR